jgi:hypothetical protein
VHGALDCGAIYHPALDGRSDERRWIQDNPDLGYVVTWNPTIQSTSVGGGNPLALNGGNHLEVHFPGGWKSSLVYIYLENSAGATRLDISRLPSEDGEKHKALERIPIPASWSGWQAIDMTAEDLAQGFRLDLPQDSNSIILRGIKADPDSLQNWPWDQGVRLVYQGAGRDATATEMSFDTASLIPYSNLSLTVVDDQGDTVLLRVNR